uniref:Pantothenate kinase n=1 Tax=Angiostrongylus cantonensis TaxID=6313 RepID=A0A0K0DAU7_ANGCA
MDELLLNSNLRFYFSAQFISDYLRGVGCYYRRADDVRNGVVRSVQPILREKPTTPFIVLPEEARFAPLVKKSRFALDIGGTLVKLVYSTVCERSIGGEPEVLLNFKKFTVIEACLEFIKENWHDRVSDDVLHCTGGGSFKYAEMMHKSLGVKVKRTDEMRSLIFGCDFLLQNNEDESFTYHHEAVGIEYQYKPIDTDSIYPFLLVNIGTGISVIKVDSPSMFQRVGGSSMGGGAFIGLGHLLTSAQNFDDLLLMAEKGDHRKCDTLVCDIYGGSYENLNLPGDLIAGSFGKCSRIGKHFKSDIAKSLLLMISNNIGQVKRLFFFFADGNVIWYAIFHETNILWRFFHSQASYYNANIVVRYKLLEQGMLLLLGMYLCKD